MPPLVSVVLTSYNQKEQFERAFNSLISQTYKSIEIIIVDDCSTDNESQSYIKWLGEQYPDIVRYHLQKKNVGIPKNKNTGFKMACGDYVTYLDGDDQYYPEKIEREVDRFLLRRNWMLFIRIFTMLHLVRVELLLGKVQMMKYMRGTS